eukprot:12407441-Prorocentrum_lima.AAC.1
MASRAFNRRKLANVIGFAYRAARSSSSTSTDHLYRALAEIKGGASRTSNGILAASRSPTTTTTKKTVSFEPPVATMVGDLLQEVAAARMELRDLHALRAELQASRQEAKRDVANALDEVRQAVK